MAAARRLLSQWAPAMRCPGELSVATHWSRSYAAEAALAEPMDTPEHEKDGKVLHPGADPHLCGPQRSNRYRPATLAPGLAASSERHQPTRHKISASDSITQAPASCSYPDAASQSFAVCEVRNAAHYLHAQAQSTLLERENCLARI